MKKLILTEKPSVARDFAKALGVTPKGSGFFENDSYVITWAIGHLLTLKAPEDYDKSLKRWKEDTLPIIPDKMKYKSISKTYPQLKIIRSILKRNDLSDLIVATDAGREGELIARSITQGSKNIKNQWRFWSSQALSPKVISEQMGKLKPLSHYDRLFYAGQSRQFADWLVGMNLTRIATIKLGDLYSIGRVQTAVLSLLVKRKMEIVSFKPETYFTISADFDFSKKKITANWFSKDKDGNFIKIKKAEDAVHLKNKIEGKDSKVVEIKSEEKSLPPPRLYSLTDLQKDANIRFGFSAKKTLSLAQSLYEKSKCLSYPRSDSKVLGTKNLDLAKKLASKFQSSSPKLFEKFEAYKLSLKNRLVFNDALLTDHHALIPLKEYKGNPQSDEGKIFNLVLTRFAMVFSKNHNFTETKIKIECEKELFRTSGKVITETGWKFLNYKKDEDIILPGLKENEIGQALKVNIKEKQTTPPPHYTEASILNDMQNPARLIQNKEYKEIFRGEIGLGTQSTRAQIIETLIQRSYIHREKKQLIANDKGVNLISILCKMKFSRNLISPNETAKWEKILNDMAMGKGIPEDFLKKVIIFVKESINEWKDNQFSEKQKNISPKKAFKKNTYSSIGSCPKCKSKVIEWPKSYGCSKWKEGCKFTIWKTMANKKISTTQAKKILEKGKSDILKNLKSKQGKVFDARLVLNKDHEVSFEF